MSHKQHLWEGGEWCDRVAGCETGHQAWERLFGEKLDTAKALSKQDEGDSCTYRMPNGHSYTYYYDGEYID